VTAKHVGFTENDFWKRFSPNSNTAWNTSFKFRKLSLSLSTLVLSLSLPCPRK